MKTGIGVFIFVFLAAMVICTMQPASLHSAETVKGGPWDQFVDSSPFTWGTKLTGPLSIYYQFIDDTTANMYYTVRLSIKGVNRTFYGSAQGVTFWPLDGQWVVIKAFLTEAVKNITNCSDESCWKLKSIDSGKLGEEEGAFVADIMIAVKE